MSAKQTAIEWLMQNIDINFNPKTNTISMKTDIWEKAIAMEKEQIIDFANKVLYNAECSFTGRAYLEKDINEFYKETYEK